MFHQPVPIDQHAYSTDWDASAPVVVRMELSGRLGRRYLDFVADRAAWLDLSGWAESRSEGEAVVVAAGPEALVGALEMACMLGPIDTLVHTLELTNEPDPVARGFVVRG